MPTFDRCPEWVRPCEWPELPDIGAAEEKVVGLVAVEDTDSEFLAVLCEGDYIVDWGDGSEPESVSSGVKAEHQYNYASIDSDPVCARPSSSSSSSGYEGYKAVIVTIIPQAPSSTSTSSSEEAYVGLTKVDFQQRHSLVGTNSHLAKWLDIELNVPNCTSLSLGADIVPGIDSEEFLIISCAHTGWLQRFVLTDHSLTSLAGLFSYCSQLKKVVLLNTGSVTDTSSMFYRCSSLLKIDLFDTSSVTSSYRMFGNCYALACVPLFDFSSVSDASYMFLDCYALPEVPLFDTSSVTTTASMFYNCHTLGSVPLFDTSSVVTMEAMFYGCTCLRRIPLFDTSSVTSMRQTFAICERLMYVPALDTSAVTDMYRIFYACHSLTVVPAFDGAAVSSSTNITDFVRITDAITRSLIYGLRYSHRYTVNAKPLTAAALNEIFTNLGTAAGSQTITITGCLGAATCDKTIATAKGWTVAG